MRLLDSRAAAAQGREPRTDANAFLRAAVLSGCAVFLCGLLLLSPLFRVRTVVWTGSVALDAPSCKRIEDATLGQSLLLLPERLLRLATRHRDGLRVSFEKHFPSTLEIHVVSSLAVAITADGQVVDGRGQVVDAALAEPTLPRLHGFALRSGRLETPGVRVLHALEELRTLPALRTERVERDGAEVVFTLARTGTRVRMRIAALDGQLHKLRVYEQSLGTDDLPAHIDLRFRHQVVVRDREEEVRSRGS